MSRTKSKQPSAVKPRIGERRRKYSLFVGLKEYEGATIILKAFIDADFVVWRDPAGVCIPTVMPLKSWLSLPLVKEGAKS